MPTYSLLTVTGKNKEAASLANGTPLKVTHLAFGDADYAPTGGETALQNEIVRKPVQGAGTVNGAPNTAYFDCVLEADDGPYTIREGGVFDEDGDLIAILKYDPPVNKPIPSSGQSVQALMRAHVVFSDLENLVIQIEAISAYVSAGRKINTAEGLTGGGDLSADRTLKLAIGGLEVIDATQIHMDNDAFVLKDDSSGTHKKVSPAEAAKALGGAPFASVLDTVAGISTTQKAHPAGVKAAVTQGAQAAVETYHTSIETRTTRLLSRVGL